VSGTATVPIVTRPVVGIPTPVEQARWARVWEADCAIVAMTYIDAVQRAGGIAMLLPPDPHVAQDPTEVLDRLDALLLAGGADLDPAAYGEAPHPQTVAARGERDAFELALVRGAIARDLPTLGVCRGMQVLNVARGGTLHQHVPELVGHEDHRRLPGTFGDHDVRLRPGSLASRASGGEVVATKSHHHQAVDRLGEGLVVTGWSSTDELPEAIELPGARFALGVQWHPEADEASVVIAALVAEARSRALAA
jgi:putative glutamine amidotransferase